MENQKHTAEFQNGFSSTAAELGRAIKDAIEQAAKAGKGVQAIDCNAARNILRIGLDTLAGGSLLVAPARAHSQKPIEFYDLVEGLCPAPRYASVFSAGYCHNDRWDSHGNDHRDQAEAAE